MCEISLHDDTSGCGISQVNTDALCASNIFAVVPNSDKSGQVSIDQRKLPRSSAPADVYYRQVAGINECNVVTVGNFFFFFFSAGLEAVD